jgi:membrane-bound ClpP family serine protease
MKKATKSEIVNILNSNEINEQQLIELRKIENELTIKERELQLDFAKLRVEDVKDARSMQMVTRAYTPAILAYMITFGFFAILILLMTNMITISGHEELLIMLGALGTAWGSVINYYFGSTLQSGRQTELLAKADSIDITR